MVKGSFTRTLHEKMREKGEGEGKRENNLIRDSKALIFKRIKLKLKRCKTGS